MGADLLLTYLPIKTGDKPDYEAGKTYIANLDINLLVDAFTEAHGDISEIDPDGDWDTLWGDDDKLLPEIKTLVRRFWTDKLNELHTALGNWNGRFNVLWQVGGYDLYITGGTSWGDDPGDDYRLIDDLYRVAGLYAEMGFAL